MLCSIENVRIPSSDCHFVHVQDAQQTLSMVSDFVLWKFGMAIFYAKKVAQKYVPAITDSKNKVDVGGMILVMST